MQNNQKIINKKDQIAENLDKVSPILEELSLKGFVNERKSITASTHKDYKIGDYCYVMINIPNRDELEVQLDNVQEAMGIEKEKRIVIIENIKSVIHPYTFPLLPTKQNKKK